MRFRGLEMEKVREIFNGKYITNNAVENVWSHVVRINVISVLPVLGHGSEGDRGNGKGGGR